MIFEVELKPRAIKDLKHLQKVETLRIIQALELLKNDMGGDVKRLTNFTPEYRLRVGNYRVLFELTDDFRIIVYRIVHRREAYR
jgi:mRNA interferase RelE/StbE